MKMSVCVDILFFRQDFLQGLEKVKKAGFDHFEMWSLGDHPFGIGAKNKDIDAIARGMQRLGLTCEACVGPFGDLTDPAGNDVFLAALQKDIHKAKKIACPTIIVNLAGAGPPANPAGTRENALKVLSAAAEMAGREGIVMALEPLNSRVDHKNSVLAHAADGFAIVDAVGSPSLKLLYDLYHQQIMDGDVTETVIANLPKIVHLHAAGVPGRHELAPGELDYRYVLKRIADAGYQGAVGLEYKPTKDALESLKEMRALTADIAR